MKQKKSAIDKALETLVSHSEQVLLGLDYATDYVFIEVPIENRLDIANHFYNLHGYRNQENVGVIDVCCDHCHKPFVAAHESKNNPKDVCHCVYKRYMNAYQGGFMYMNESAIQYNTQFGKPSHKSSNSIPLVRSLYEKTDDDHDNSWILRHGNVVTVSRSFGEGVSVENNLTLGIAHVEEDYAHHRAQSKAYRDHDKKLTKEHSDPTNVIYDANFENDE